jgi:hypothetical protein
LVVVWVQQEQQQQQQQGQHPSGSSQDHTLVPLLEQCITDAGPGMDARVLLAVADVTGSAANAGLAGALKVAAPLPCLHVYQVCVCVYVSAQV